MQLERKFSKGIIDADLFNKAIAQLYPSVSSDSLQKGEIMNALGYGYGGGSEPIKFTKTGKELKEMMPGVIAKLNAKKTVLSGQMAAFKTLAGIDPGQDGRYDWKCCETYDEATKKYLEPTDSQKACRAYNNCGYELRSIDEDLRACQAIMTGVDEKQKYNLTISQLIALNVS